MSPTGAEHGWIEGEIAGRLRDFVKQKRLGWVLTGEVGIYTRRNPDRVRGADVLFLSRGRSPERPSRRFLETAPELIVEVVSPDDRWPELRQKIEEYFAIGVERVWIVEPQERAVSVFRSTTESLRLMGADTLEGEGALAGFHVAIRELFAE